jgi:tRNA A37 threonylcarbamoyladenosine synthetase subunit TsaC/SUA5/YrdC
MTEIKDELDDQLEGIPDGKDGKDMDPSAVRRLAHLQCEQRRRE